MIKLALGKNTVEKPASMSWPCFGLLLWLTSADWSFGEKLTQLQTSQFSDPDIRRTAKELYRWFVEDIKENGGSSTED